MFHLHRLFVLALTLVAIGCGTPEAGDGVPADVGPADVETRDGSTSVDLGGDASDAGVFTDGSIDLSDTGEAGFGTISGTCGVLDDELTSDESHLFRNAIDFGDDPYDDSDAPRLTDGSREIIADGNENENSILSEVFAYEVLSRCEDAALLKTEKEIDYEPMSKKTDLLLQIEGEKIGVSVTRAVGFPRDDPYTQEQASTLLEEKLGDVLLSSEGVLETDRWRKQILHVIAYAPGHADSIDAAYADLAAEVRADTIVWVTVSDGEDEFLY